MTTPSDRTPAAGFPGAVPAPADPPTGRTGLPGAVATSPDPSQAPLPPAFVSPAATARKRTGEQADAPRGRRTERLERRHGDGALLRGGRAVLHVVSQDPYPQAFARAAAAAQHPITTGRRLAVVSADGGVGRSTVTAVLGQLYASLRHDHVAVADLRPGPSPLPVLTGAPDRGATVSDLVTAFGGHDPGGPADLAAATASAGPTLHVVGGDAGDQHLDPASVPALHRILSRCAAVSVLDCPAGLVSPLTRAALREAHAVLVVGRATPTGVEHLASAARRVAAAPDAPPVLAVVVATTADRALPVAAAARDLRSQGLTVHALGFDRHLAGGVRIRLERVGETRRLVVAELAADALTLARTGGLHP